MNLYHRPNETAESRFRLTSFLVEANEYEALSLWEKHAKDSPNKINNDAVCWHQISPGWLVEVGKLDGRPVCISTDWVELEGILVCFYHATSEVVDHKLINEWLEKRCDAKWDDGTRRAHCNAMNFHHCLAHVAVRPVMAASTTR